jgi:ATP-dependent DNA ligase
LDFCFSRSLTSFWHALEQKSPFSGIEERGEDLFKLTVDRDLEGIVGKWKRGAYREGDKSTWVKIKNSHYSQIVGREKLFEKRLKQK